MGKISSIVNVDITIDQPAQDSASYNNMLVIIDKPATPRGTMGDVVAITSAGDLTEFGYTAEEEAYKAMTVVFSQSPKPDVAYVAVRQTSEGVLETADITLERAVGVNGWYGVGAGYEANATDLEAIAKWVEANEKLFGFTWTTGDCPIDISAYDRTYAIYSGGTKDNVIPDGNKYAGLAWMAKCFGYNAGSETWSFKTLSSVVPSVLSEPAITELENASKNFYHSVGGSNITQEGKVGTGEWIDIIRFRDWLKNEIQAGVYSYLKANRKVEFNDDGITGVQNIIEEKLKAGVDAGGIDKDRFDDEDVIDRAYVVNVPKSSSISDSDKKKRKLMGVTFSARLAGAIHYAKIAGSLVY